MRLTSNIDGAVHEATTNIHVQQKGKRLQFQSNSNGFTSNIDGAVHKAALEAQLDAFLEEQLLNRIWVLNTPASINHRNR